MSHPSLSTTLDRLRIFLLTYLLLLVGGLVLYLLMPREGAIVMALQHWRDMSWSPLMIVVTRLGEYPVVVGALAIIAYLRRDLLLPTIVNFVLLGAVVYLLKEYYHAPRPMTFFQGSDILQPVPGYTPNRWLSFPSGHTALIFNTVTCILVAYPARWAQLVLLVVAVAVGFSRIFLAEHFLADVLVGSLVGVSLSLIVYSVAFFIRDQRGRRTKA